MPARCRPRQWTRELAAAALVLAASSSLSARAAEPFARALDDHGVVLAVCVSQDLVNRVLLGEIQQTAPVQEWVLGAAVTGRADTKARLKIDFDPALGYAELSLLLEGNTVADTTGVQGPALVYSIADTEFVARKKILFDSRRGVSTGKAQIDATTRRRVTGIESPLPGLRGRLVRRVTRRRLCELEGQLNAIAAHNAETRIAASFDEAANERLQRLNELLYIIAPAWDEYRRVGQLEPFMMTLGDFWYFCLRRKDAAADPRGFTVTLADAAHPAPRPPQQSATVQVWLQLADSPETRTRIRQFWDTIAPVVVVLLDNVRVPPEAAKGRPELTMDLQFAVHHGYLSVRLMEPDVVHP